MYDRGEFDIPMQCVTSFSAEGYEKYGKRFLETYCEHHDIPIDVYIEEECDFSHPLVTFKQLYLVPGCVDFLRKCQFPIMHGVQLDGTRLYQYNAGRFCRKVYAQIGASEGSGWLYWLDADIEFDQSITFPEKDTFLLYLGREQPHTCTSFVGFNLDHPVSKSFWKIYREFYDHGLVFTLPQWHDCAVLDAIRTMTGLPAISLTSGEGNVFDGAFPGAHHRKGVWKLNFINRYQELAKLVEKLNPESILEIGTFDGGRALSLCKGGASYVGFDLFEEATIETDKTEKNVKAHHSMESVSDKLKAAGIVHSLVGGNTRKTLPAYISETNRRFDFAFIDGGHSIETIQSDWFHVKQLMNPGATVVFDDYYEEIPTDQYGANSVVDKLNYTLSEMADPVKGGGRTRLAIVEC